MQAETIYDEEVDVDDYIDTQTSKNGDAKTHIMMNGNMLHLSDMDESELTNYSSDNNDQAPPTRRQSRFENYNKERTASFVAPHHGGLNLEETAPVATGHMNVTRAHFDDDDDADGEQDPQQKPGVIKRRQTRFEEYTNARSASIAHRGDQGVILPPAPEEAPARRQSRFEEYNKERIASFLAPYGGIPEDEEEAAPHVSSGHHHVTFTESTRDGPVPKETQKPDQFLPPPIRISNFSNASTLTSHQDSTGQEKPPGAFVTKRPDNVMADISESTSVATPVPSKGQAYLLDDGSEYSEALEDELQQEDWVPDLVLPGASQSRRFTDAVIDPSKGQMQRHVSGLTHFTGLDDFHQRNSVLTDYNHPKSGYFDQDKGGDEGGNEDIEDYVYGDDRGKSSMTIWVVMCALCLFLLAGVVPIVVCGFLGECSSDSSNDVTSTDATNVTASPTINPNPPSVVTVPPRPGTNTISFVEIELGATGATLDIPAYALSKLDDPLSPQANAFWWFAYNYSPEVLAAMPMWRRQQIFALATFYYSLRGSRWDPVDQKAWINPKIDECQWSTDIICYFEPESAALEIPEPNSGIDLRGRVRAIRMHDFTAPLELSDSMGVTGVPPEVELLQWMQILELESLKGLEDTSLEALLPLPELASMPFLWSLGATETQMTGTLPTELGLLTELRFLKLFQNQFTGTIPSELGLMIDLTDLYLDSNDLTGTVPAPICDLTVVRSGLDLDIDCQVICPATGCACHSVGTCS